MTQRRLVSSLGRWLVLTSALLGAACAANTDESARDDGAITSNDGEVLEFKFRGEVIAGGGDRAREAVVSQLQYMQGILTTAHRANAQVGLVTLSEVVEKAEGNTKRIQYTASLPVIWPKGDDVLPTYDLALPVNIGALADFNDKYDGKCGNNEYGRETFWHDFNLESPACALEAGDVWRGVATVRPNPKTTKDKYPEYDKIWEDDALDVVAVFGIIDGNTPDDEGARELENVVTEAGRSLTGVSRTDGEPNGTILKDATITGETTVAGRARKVRLTALLVAAVSDVGPEFDERYAPLSEKADLVIYSGHSGLGKNINALAAKTRATQGKFQLVYLNGCQTFAYLGTDLYDRRIALNGAAADPNGTKFLDVVANALPAYGDNGRTSLTLYQAILETERGPRSYSDLLREFSTLHLVAVFGEEDNEFKP